MDLVAITDHDTIDGALALLERMPDARDIIVGEEVSCWLPDGDVRGAPGRLRDDRGAAPRAAAAAAQRVRRRGAPARGAVFFALNHLLHFYEPRGPLDAYLRLLDVVPALEVQKRRHGAGAQPADRADWRQRGRRPGWPAPGGRGRQRRAHAAARRHDVDRGARPRPRRVPVAACAPVSDARAGATAGALAVSGDAYGVIGGYIASLAGLAPRDHQWLAARRLSRLRGRIAAVSVPAVRSGRRNASCGSAGRCARSNAG